MTQASTFTAGDLVELTGIVAAGWREATGRDWSVRAGTLDWSCARTADHAVDTVLAPAFFLASRRQAAYPTYGASTPGPEASPDDLAGALETATRILVAVVTAAPPGTRAIIWRRPAPETRPPEDFLPRAGLELALHAHDVAAGLGLDYAPPRALCDRLRRHTTSWPHWHTPGWSPPTLAGDPWADLLHASGRGATPTASPEAQGQPVPQE